MSLDKRISAQALGSSGPAYLDFYYILLFPSGHILLPLLAATFLFSRTAKRNATLINVLFVFIYTDIVSCFLLYNGTQIGPQPPQSLCIVQTALLNGGPPAWAVAVLMLVVNMWYNFRYPKRPINNPWIKAAILAAPWITAVIWIIPAAVLSASMPDKVNRDRRFFYCSIDFSPYSTPAELFEGVVNVATLVFEVKLALHLSRSWKALRRAGNSTGIDVGFIVRVLVFGLYILIGLGISFAMVWSPESVFPDLYAASVGLSAFLVFGTQRDVARAWCFWRADGVRELSVKNKLRAFRTAAGRPERHVVAFPPPDAMREGMGEGKVVPVPVTIIRSPEEAFERGSAFEV